MPRAARIPSQLWLVFATLIGGTFLLSDLAPKPSNAANHADAAHLGATARQAMIELERWGGSPPVTGVALVIAVGEPRC